MMMRSKGQELALAMFAFSLILCSFFGESSSENTIALIGAKIYPSPTENPILNGVVLISKAKIMAVGPKEKIKIPANATILKCEGMFLTAGFQNSHVHFTETKWENAANLRATELTEQLMDMLTGRGFTTVVDTGSSLENTLALRRRIESGEFSGPRILTAGTPFYPENGIPFYLRNSLPSSVLSLLHTPKTEEEAVAVAKKQLSDGADLVKLFTGSWVERGRVLPMSQSIATAITTEAHRRGKLVFTHASNIAGLEVALNARVDVLAHALDDDRGWNESHISRMKANGMSMVPTLKLFSGAPYTKYILKEVEDFSRAGGQILFGTDVGYLNDYDPTHEYELLAQAGLSWKQILASLTTAPAERFGEGKGRGRVAAGQDADIVVLASDPATDVKAFSSVRYTVRAGRVLYKYRGRPASTPLAPSGETPAIH